MCILSPYNPASQQTVNDSPVPSLCPLNTKYVMFFTPTRETDVAPTIIMIYNYQITFIRLFLCLPLLSSVPGVQCAPLRYFVRFSPHSLLRTNIRLIIIALQTSGGLTVTRSGIIRFIVGIFGKLDR